MPQPCPADGDGRDGMGFWGVNAVLHEQPGGEEWKKKFFKREHLCGHGFPGRPARNLNKHCRWDGLF